MRYIIGIDPSSQKLTAIVTNEAGQLIEPWIAYLPEAAIEVRCDWAEDHVRHLVANYTRRGNTAYVFIEDAVVGRGGAHATIVQSEVRGAMLVGARRGGATEIHGANNSRWKKAIIGKGNATKPEITAWAAIHWRDLWNTSVDIKTGMADQDLIDAGCINRYGDKVLKMSDRINTQRAKDQA